MRRAIVVVEVALVCVLLTGAGLLVRSLTHLLDVDLGFTSDNVMAVRVDPGPAYETLAQKNAYFDDVLRNVRAVPGVETVGLTDALPLGDNFGWRRWTASAKERASQEDTRQNPLIRIVDDGYLAAMGIPLRAGRGFTPADHAASESVVIISETLAGALWPDEDPLGRVVVTSRTEWRVVGVVGSVRYFALDRDTDAEMYLPLRQTGDYAVVDLVVRGAIAPANLVPGVRAALRRADPNLPATEFRTMQQLMDHSVFGRRFVALSLAGFAGFGLVLAALGIYAVISYAVSQRRQEFGLRMALGASPGDIHVRVLTQTATLALIGLAAGIPASWVAARTIQALLFGVEPSDPATFGAVLVLLVAVVALAGYVPARRASRIDPATALRAD